MSGYNGWANYATWCVKLWLDNDPYTYERALDVARAVHDDEGDARDVGDALKAELPEIFELPVAGLAGDLVGAALSEVDWAEIGKVYLEEVSE